MALSRGPSVPPLTAGLVATFPARGLSAGHQRSLTGSSTSAGAGTSQPLLSVLLETVI